MKLTYYLMFGGCSREPQGGNENYFIWIFPIRTVFMGSVVLVFHGHSCRDKETHFHQCIHLRLLMQSCDPSIKPLDSLRMFIALIKSDGKEINGLLMTMEKLSPLTHPHPKGQLQNQMSAYEKQGTPHSLLFSGVLFFSTLPGGARNAYTLGMHLQAWKGAKCQQWKQTWPFWTHSYTYPGTRRVERREDYISIGNSSQLAFSELISWWMPLQPFSNWNFVK